MVQNGQEVRHHEVDRTLTDRDKATCQQAIGIGHCIGQYRPDKRSPLDTSTKKPSSSSTSNSSNANANVHKTASSSTAEAAKKGKQWCLDDFEIGKTLIRGSAYCPRPSILRDINRKSDPVPDNTKSIVDQL
eukprot:scaffold3045_cov271-Chaetoceros_neogracile.AAC.2